MDEFEERRRIGRGRFFTRTDLAKREGALLGSFMQQIPALMVHGAQDGEYVVARGVRCHERVPPMGRGRTVETGGGEMCGIIYVPGTADRARGVPIACFAKVYVDNQLMNPGTPTPPFNLRETPPTMVEAMEVYSRPAEVPWKYQHLNSGCGVVIIHTRRPK